MVPSRMTRSLLTWGDGGTVELSMDMENRHQTTLSCLSCLKFALHLGTVHCSTKLSVWAGAALYLSKLRLC